MAVVAVLKLLLKLLWCYAEVVYRFFLPKPPKDIRGQVVLVTGAARGIGKCLAVEFHRRGAKLALCDINAAGVKQTAEEIEGMGGIAHFYQCDVTKPDEVETMAASLIQTLGHVDILVNNAGVLNFKSLINLSRSEIRRTVDVNLLASFWTVKQFLPQMLSRNRGHVVSICSTAAKYAVPGMTDYSASKFGLFGFTEALAEEIRTVHGKPGVQTTTACLSIVQTDMGSMSLDGAQTNPRREKLQPEKVAVDVVNGVLLNKREIYLPPAKAAIDLFRALAPMKARASFIDYSKQESAVMGLW